MHCTKSITAFPTALLFFTAGKLVFIKGRELNEYFAEKVIDAINMGFPIKIALLIKNEDFMLEVMNIKNFTSKKDFERIRARIIGKEGKAIKTISKLTKCFLEIKGNEVGIIGEPENIENGHQAVISLIQGSKHANVYKYLESHRPTPILDLGLKEIKKERKKE